MNHLLKEINPAAISNKNVFDLIANKWMLITAGDSENSLNTMTASWGCLGSLWGKNIAICYVRPERHTFKFIENNDYYSLSFYPEKYKETLTYCGTHSGRDVNKVKETNLTLDFTEKAPYFKEANLVFICKKIYSDYINEDNFSSKAVKESVCSAWYDSAKPEDFHKFYIGEIVKTLSSEC